MRSLKVATWVHEISGYRGVAAVQRWAGSRRSPLIPSEAQKASKSCSVCQQKRETADGHVADCLGEGPEQSWQERQVLEALGSYEWVLTGIELILAWALLTGGRCGSSECYKRTCFVPIWMGERCFFRPRNTLYSPSCPTTGRDSLLRTLV